MNIEDWLSQNSRYLANDWERMFVKAVLSRVDELDWESIQAQMSFRDRDGKQRYADFAIAEGDHLKIAIEVDGYDKTGRGTGMTHAEFVDWQRRQNALTDQGWFVLRFANRDVRDHPDRCAEHIDLLLRKKRQEMSHHESIHKKIIALEGELETAHEKVAEKAKKQSYLVERERTEAKEAIKKQKGLEKELREARRQMKRAENAPELDTREAEELAALNKAQEEELEKLKSEVEKQAAQIEEGEGEQDKMKTAIWAFAVVIITAMGMLVWVTSSRAPSESASESGFRESSVSIGENCTNPATWKNAQNYLDRRAALEGPVEGVTYRSQSPGQPTWINIGAPFPDNDRLVLVIWGRNRDQFESLLSRLSTGQTICAIGEVSEYRGTAQIELERVDQIKL